MLISFLIGIGWGMALVGALSAFFSFFPSHFFLGLLAAILGAVPGLILVVFLEYLLLKSEALMELKRQTHLLETLSQSS